MSLLKLAVYSVGGAVGLAAVAGFGGVGLVAGGAAAGLSALEVAVVGGGAGATVYKLRQDNKRATVAQRRANAEQAKAKSDRQDLSVKIAKARKVLDELEA